MMKKEKRYTNRQAQKQLGFTIAEVLIAITVLAFVTATLLPILFGTSRGSARIETSSQIREDLRQSRALFTNIFANLVWPETNQDVQIVTGDGQNMIVHSYNAGADPLKIKLTIQQSSQSTSLVGETSSLLENLPASETEVIMENTTDLKFSYYGDRSSSSQNRFSEPIWGSSWREAKPPLLIRIKGASSHSGKVPSPFIIDIPVQSAAPLTCPYDPVSRSCRQQ